MGREQKKLWTPLIFSWTEKRFWKASWFIEHFVKKVLLKRWFWLCLLLSDGFHFWKLLELLSIGHYWSIGALEHYAPSRHCSFHTFSSGIHAFIFLLPSIFIHFHAFHTDHIFLWSLIVGWSMVDFLYHWSCHNWSCMIGGYHSPWSCVLTTCTFQQTGSLAVLKYHF